MAEESSARENPQQDVILIQEAVGDSLQGFRAVPPGASPTVDPIIGIQRRGYRPWTA